MFIWTDTKLLIFKVKYVSLGKNSLHVSKTTKQYLLSFIAEFLSIRIATKGKE